VGGFFEENAELLKGSGGGNYVSEAEKIVLAEEGIAFPLVKVEFQPDNTFNGKPRPRFVATTEIEGEERLMSFGLSTTDNPSSRDRLLAVAREWLEAGKDPIEVKFEKIGRYFGLVEA